MAFTVDVGPFVDGAIVTVLHPVPVPHAVDVRPFLGTGIQYAVGVAAFDPMAVLLPVTQRTAGLELPTVLRVLSCVPREYSRSGRHAVVASRGPSHGEIRMEPGVPDMAAYRFGERSPATALSLASLTDRCERSRPFRHWGRHGGYTWSDRARLGSPGRRRSVPVDQVQRFIVMPRVPASRLQVAHRRLHSPLRLARRCPSLRVAVWSSAASSSPCPDCSDATRSSASRAVSVSPSRNACSDLRRCRSAWIAGGKPAAATINAGERAPDSAGGAAPKSKSTDQSSNRGSGSPRRTMNNFVCVSVWPGLPVLQPHREALLERVQVESTVLLVQDTATLNYTNLRGVTRGLGPLQDRASSSRGLFVHAAVGFTEGGRPLGVSALERWARPEQDHGQAVRVWDAAFRSEMIRPIEAQPDFEQALVTGHKVEIESQGGSRAREKRTAVTEIRIGQVAVLPPKERAREVAPLPVWSRWTSWR